MGRLSWALIALTGCNSILGIGDPGSAPADGPAYSCPIEGTDLCAYEAPYGPIRITTDTTIDTTSDCNVVLIAPGGGSVCVLYGSTIDVIAKLRGRGARPLVLAATGAITISGKVDVSSNQISGRGAASAANDLCATYQNVTYGGGAGGSFHGSGGNGGTGMGSSANTGIVAQAGTTAAPTNLTGGCDAVGTADIGGGQGAGGGAVELASGTSIEIGATGVVSANGEGGNFSGGGAGGMIELSAPSIAIHGVIVANGGGGGQGIGAGFTAVKGADGADSATPALGGFGGAQASGGAGGAGSTPNGTKGSDANVMNYGGGYGGGGVGFIVIDTPPSDTSGGVISPTPTSS
ncbi:MAG: hypothetical protein QM831_30030 [Kofleriaceae bacterium]